MTKTVHFVFAVVMIFSLNGLSAAAQPQKKSESEVRSQELVGTITAIDLENSTLDLQYGVDDQTNQAKSDTFYITDATTIDVASVKSSLKDLKIGSNILLEYAQMPDGAKVVESVWVKKS